MKRLAALCIVTIFSMHAQLGHAQSINPEKIIKKHFWGSLYKKGGETFYCQKKFKKKNSLITEGYVYSTTLIREHLDCGTPRQCRKNSDEFKKMISDLHNIVPAQSVFEHKKRNSTFAAIEDEVEVGNCNTKTVMHMIEPRKEIRGDIARILLYMQRTYNLPLNARITDLLDWNEIDPPSAEEIERNEKISKIQGNSNPYVLDPALANELR